MNLIWRPRPSQSWLKILVALATFFLLLHPFGISLREFITFLFLWLFLVVFPGKALLDWLKIPARGALLISLVFSLGMVSATLGVKFSRLIRAEFLFFLWLIICFTWWVRSQVVPRGGVSFSFQLSLSRMIWIGGGLVFSALLLVILLDHFPTGLILPSGDLSLRMRFYDGFLRIAVIRELVHSIPPQMPFAAGNPLSYHYGMDLFLSLFVCYGHLDVFDVGHRLGLTFFVVLLFLNLILFLRSLLNSDHLTVFGTFLLLFGSGGLTYVFALICHAPLTGNIFFNFYFHDLLSLNSFLPGLALLASGLLALSLYEKEKEKGWLILASLFLAALFEYKVFFLIPVAGGLFLASLAQLIFNKNKTIVPITLLTAIFSFPLVLPAFVLSKGAMGYRFQLGPVDWIVHILRELRLESWHQIWQRLISPGPKEPVTLLIAAAAIGIFLCGAFGLNLLAIFQAFRSLLSPSILKSFLSGFFLVSMATFFGVSLYLGKLSRNLLNIYVFYLGLISLTIFFLLGLEEKLEGKGKFKQIAILSLVALLTIPNTVFYLESRLKNPEPRLFSRALLEAASWVERKSPPETVILHPSDMRYVCYFAGRRVVLDNSIHSYLPFHLPLPLIRERLGDVDRFFSQPERNLDVLKKYKVGLLWVDRERGFSGGEIDSASGRIRLRPGSGLAEGSERSVILQPIFINSGHIIYQVYEEDN